MSHKPLLTVFVILKSRLLARSARLLGNRDDASDAVQEAVCRLWPIRERISSEEEAARMAGPPLSTSKEIPNLMH